MKVTRKNWDGTDPAELATELRSLTPPPEDVTETVADVIAQVEQRGDQAVLELAAKFGESPTHGLRVPDQMIKHATWDEAMFTTAVNNVREVAEAQAEGDRVVDLPEGQSISIREIPVASAAIYAPGGAAIYPSTVIMGCVAAKVAGVERIALATPPGDGGEVDDSILTAARLSGADEVYAVGGAQAIAALALGTETVAPVDVIAGPGNNYVQEAKRQLFGRVGIDGIAGPSELMVIAGETADPRWLALDLCAQAEHAKDSLLVAAAVETRILDSIEAEVLSVAAANETVAEAPMTLIEMPDTDAGIALANALAPEHLEIAADDARILAQSVRTAGCVFLGDASATAFGDYVAGSNHVLPTGGAGRFQGPLGPNVFRRTVATVEIDDAAEALAGPGATLARAEGFPVHAESMEARTRPQ